MTPELGRGGLRVAFAGTPAFAEVALQALLDAGHTVPLVWTQPDRPAGRGMKSLPSPVKALALRHGIAVGQPCGLKLDGRYAADAAQARAALEAAAVDVMVVAAYGLILPAWVLAAPPGGCLNIHASLLPRWRGAAPIHRAIEAGDAETGVTLMQMDAGLDTGDMLLRRSEPIAPDDTTARLHDRLAALGGKLMLEALRAYREGRLAPVAQPVEGVTYAAKIDKAEAVVDWSGEALTIERRIRAFDPFPGAHTLWQGQPLKLWQAQAVADDANAAPGTVLAAGPAGLRVQCGAGTALEVTALQRPGGKRLAAAVFFQGQPAGEWVGARLGAVA
jgi:methionyl-tRNA formyltransferase